VEYLFCIIKLHGEDKHETRIWNGRDLPPDVTGENRRDGRRDSFSGAG
jgi:hypothetical protein